MKWTLTFQPNSRPKRERTMSDPATSSIRLAEDLSDWWVYLEDHSVIRTWGSVVKTEGGMVCFGGISSQSGRFVELCAIDENAVIGVVRGTGRNGLPHGAQPPLVDRS